MALFKNMSITSKGISLFTKAQAGNPIHFTKMRVGSGNVGTQNPLLLIDLVDGKLDVPISSITPKPEKKTATIVGNVDNTGLLEPLYICEIGIYAQDPDEGEILYGYSNCGEYGDYYAPETQGPYSWQYQIAVAIGNAANVTVELTKLNLDYTVMSTNTSFVVLSGGNQKELNKSIDTKLKTQGESITKNASDIVAIGTDLTNFKEETSTQMADIIPKGLISMWSGLIANIPSGWALCDGTNGTPNLKDRFIMGATTDVTINNTGGQNEVTLTVNQIPSHNHSGSTNSAGAHTHYFSKSLGGFQQGGQENGQNISGSKTVSTDSAGSHSHTLNINNTGNNQAHENRPAYYTLAFIIKL